MSMNQDSDFSTLTVEDLLGFLNCSQEELVNEARNKIKDQFSRTSDKWLVFGLLDYFFATNSKRILDLLIEAPEPHCRHLTEKISSGIRSSNERFQYLSILLYAVSSNPPPVWVRKIPNNILKDLLEILCSSRESDISVLVSGVMVLVLLLPMLPFECTQHLTKMFECFWKLLIWAPCREQDISFKPYLQVAVYSLFHRLYALYPCNFVQYMRMKMVNQANNDKAWFLSTLRPMLERVRFHPLLVSETKDTEIFRSRWVGLETSDLIHECAKLCLDPIQEICEETYSGTGIPPKRQSIFEAVPETSDCYILCSSENSFWSPGAVQSPKTIDRSVPHTPVYAYKLLVDKSTGVAESPPEAAVEATPETTPFTSPAPFMTDSSFIGLFPPSKVYGVDDGRLEHSPFHPLSPSKREEISLQLPQKHGQPILKSQKSHLHNKLQEIQQQRTVRQTDDSSVSIAAEDKRETFCQNEQQNGSSLGLSKNVCDESKIPSGDVESTRSETIRQRKLAVGINKACDYEGDLDLFTDDKDRLDHSPAPVENGVHPSATRKDSEDSCNEGLGLPCRGSMTEMMKTVKTNRIRFLSQCGPPPNISLLTELGSCTNVSRSIPNIGLYGDKHKSKSYPDLFCNRLYSPLQTRPEFIISPILSPEKHIAEFLDQSTQTEEAPLIDPYEQLLEALTIPIRSLKKDTKVRDKEMLSPHQLLDQFIDTGCSDDPPSSKDTCSEDICGVRSNKHLRQMQCLLMLERHKREVHAERNRRLLGKIKRLNLLQENDARLCREKNSLKDEIGLLHASLRKQQEKCDAFKMELNVLAEKESLMEAQERQSTASIQRDHLLKSCESLQKEKINLTKDLESCRNAFRECQRQLNVHSRHSAENVELRNQVENLNRRMLIMGEIQIELQQQLEKYKYSQHLERASEQALEKRAFALKIQELEQKNKSEKVSLDAALFRIKELEGVIASHQIEKDKHRQEMELSDTYWRERCDALEKRNKDLYSINITLENHMTQLLKCRREKGAEVAAEAKRPVPSTSRDGFSTAENSAEFSLPEMENASFIASMSSSDVRPIGAPSLDK